jgi:hypothetical protein
MAAQCTEQYRFTVAKTIDYVTGTTMIIKTFLGVAFCVLLLWFLAPPAVLARGGMK